MALAALGPCRGWRFGTCRIRHVWGMKVFRRASLLSSAKPSSSLPFSLSTISAQHFAVCFPVSLSFLPCPGVRVGQNEDVFPGGHRCYGAVKGCHVLGLLPLRRVLGRSVGYYERNKSYLIEIRAFRRRALMHSITMLSVPAFLTTSSFTASPTLCCPFLHLTPLQSPLKQTRYGAV